MDVTIVFRETFFMHKAMQDDTVAKQTSDYIPAKPITISIVSPVQCLQYP